MKKEKTIGILGGMGPEATIDLFAKIVHATPANRDQDHLRVIVDCNPKIPDRVKALFENAEDPTPALVSTAKNLERAGAGLLVIPCNAAHYYHGEIAKNVSIPVLHMIEETAVYCQRRFPTIKTFGLLAGSSTVALELYPKAFEPVQGEIIKPDTEDQDRVMGCVYRVKSGDLGDSVRSELLRVAQTLAARGAQVIILGCTEIPPVLRDGDTALPFVDPTQILAEAAVAMARGERILERD